MLKHTNQLDSLHEQRFISWSKAKPGLSDAKTPQMAADGSGDFIVDLPPELLAQMGLGLGDLLTVEMVDGAIALKPETYTSPSA
ncbi:AbrB/MazE/SpoVT family DNA-binding domain-containing protein [Pseudomonas sp. 7P_10.2_Bac1]|uniref:AbrB/MazE/SpoVT family DNA-binding domain-containing protein n=1 Tax=Pseudomonas sp. 7P_10.2_Bac1 TaxID=2971614 RepID=UPI0029055F96|nr:AbrB/MazE/SpoVT family DNA-binding domain-containing protein [Pseudomonas sp. 7P_10.2_Bac1]